MASNYKLSLLLVYRDSRGNEMDTKVNSQAGKQERWKYMCLGRVNGGRKDHGFSIGDDLRW